MEGLTTVLKKAGLLKGFAARLILFWTSLFIIMLAVQISSGFDIDNEANKYLGGLMITLPILHVALELSAWAIKALSSPKDVTD